MAKEFTYMGKTLNELQQLSLDDFAKLTNARARRSIVRGLDKPTLSKVQEAFKIHKGAKLAPTVKAIRTHVREFVIIPQMVGLKMAVHKGNSFEQVEIQPEMIGHRVGEYILTRKQVKHGKAGIGSTKSSSAVTAK
jgi:small subunit ribosomal protein S19